MVPSLAAPPTPARIIPGHDRWHPGIPAVAEVITGGSVRLECQRPEPGGEALLCGPIGVVGAEPGDVIVVDVLGIGRTDGQYSAAGHPGVIGCAPGSVLTGDEPMSGQALRSVERGRDIWGCMIARLTVGSRVLLPVQVYGAKLSVGDLHFPDALTCEGSGASGWIDLRVNLTKGGVARFQVRKPLLMPVDSGPAT